MHQIRTLPLQPEEREVLIPRDKLSVSEWAAERRILSSKNAAFSGKWSNEISPFSVEIMDSLSDVTTREVWVQKCAQGSGSEMGLNFLGQTVDEDPCPFQIVMPTENDAKKRLRTKIRPMFEATPSLLRHLRKGDINSFNVGQETELDNMFLYIAWSGSAAALADVAIRRIILDEAAKYQAAVGEEAGSFDLARDRLTTYQSTSKLYAPSTPILAGDPFDLEFLVTDQRQSWFKCPFCEQRHIPRWEYVELEKDSAGHLLSPRDYLQGDCARYRCPKCGESWSEQDRWQASSAGKWAPRDCKVDPDGRIIGKVFSNPNKGYRISAFMLYPAFMSIKKLAHEWAKADIAWKKGDSKPKQNFINSRMGEPWEIKEKSTDEKRLMLHIGSYEPEKIYPGMQMMFAGADVQDDHVWLSVLAWGYLSEVWSTWEGRIQTGDTRLLGNLDILRMYLNRAWPFEGDPKRTMRITTTAIDCNYRPDTVKAFRDQCTELDILTVRGDNTVKSRVYRAVAEPGPPGLEKRYRYDLNVNPLKDSLYRLIFESKVHGAGYFHFHKETTREVIGQLTSEEKKTVRSKRGVAANKWVTKTEHSENHLWDCNVYALFAAQLRGAMALPDPKMVEMFRKQKQQQQQKSRRGGGFLDDLPEIRF